MTSKLSVFAKPTHGDEWLRYVQAIQPYDVLLLDPDIQQVSDVYKVSPDSEITIRRWDWDDGRTKENPDGVYRELANDPVGAAEHITARYHDLIMEWENEAPRRGIPFPPRNKLVAHLINEPDTNHLLPQINTFTVTAARKMASFGVKVDGLNLSTGHPAHLKDGKPDWSILMPALQALAETGSYAVEHEYFNTLGIEHPSVNPWHILRHLWMPRGAKIKIGEFGLEQILNSIENDHQGWIDRISGDAMVSAVDWYLGKVRDDVVAVRIYMTDYVDRKWRTFDTTPIHRQLIEVARRHPSKPFVTNLPLVGSAPVAVPKTPTAVVSSQVGANLRSGPGIGYQVVDAVAKDVHLPVIGTNPEMTWWKVQHENGQVWISGTVVNLFNVNNVPVVSSQESTPVVVPSTPSSEAQAWKRCLAFILRWEGGWADDPNDPGGATMKGITIGTYTRWRKAQGKPAPSKEELHAIPDAEVEEIYRQWYWVASGANRLAWPMCLAVVDLAVNGGVERSKEAFNASGGDFTKYMAWRLIWYTRIDGWKFFSAAWTRRCAELMQEAVK